MRSIAKKSKKVKGGKGQKQAQTPPRYTLKKDSLGRRYAIDKRTGQRVSVSKAEKERVQRKKAKELFRGIAVTKQPKRAKGVTTRQKRSEASKKGWETRRKKQAIAKLPTQEQLIELGEQYGIYAIPKDMRMHVLGGVADRAELYPLVQNAATEAMSKLQIEFWTRQEAVRQGRPAHYSATPRFDRMFGVGLSQIVRDRLALSRDLQDIDQIIEEMAEDPDFDVPARELYTLYFSPEVA